MANPSTASEAIKIYLIRHGEAAARFYEHPDPGLSEMGAAQAAEIAALFAPQAKMRLFSSPKQRALQTAAPLAQAWRCAPLVDARMIEVPTPERYAQDRQQWINRILQANWTEAAAEIGSWRQGIIEFLQEIHHDSVIFSHFVAVNAAVGYVTRAPRVINFRPDHCSITILEKQGNEFRLLQQGAAANSVIL